jgi:CHASE2 domain-containing sensor protein
MVENLDTLKTSGIGLGSWWLTVSGWLPDFISVCVGIATILYLMIKIYKEIRRI